jgi:ATP-dependent DNA helicase RecG
MGDDAITLKTPLVGLPGIGPATARKLRALGVGTLGGLLASLPMRHERQEAENLIVNVIPGQIATARGEITAMRVVGRGKRPRVEAALMDESGRLDLVWFNQGYMAKRIEPGMRVRVQGEARRYGQTLQMANPRLEVMRPESDEPEEKEQRLRPVYSASAEITSRQIEACIAEVLEIGLALIEDHLPEEYRRARALPTLAEAYRGMHAPTSEEQIKAARRRLAFDELLLLQLGVHMKRAQQRMLRRAPALNASDAIDRHIRARLPFALTPSQNAVVAALRTDLALATPCNRLIQGDVGSGKTAVAAYAMLMATASGHQSAFMAPTTLLAEQQHASLAAMLAGSKVRVGLLTGELAAAARKELLAKVRGGEIDILIGTHALLTERVAFKSLAVAVIDEQHRFGVHQRAALRAKGEDERSAPHVLVMTATPIPRTLAITLFGDLDISTIDRPPPGRKPVKTRLVTPAMREEVYRFVDERVGKGDQAFVVVPAVGEEEGSNAGEKSNAEVAEGAEDAEKEREGGNELGGGADVGAGVGDDVGSNVVIADVVGTLEELKRGWLSTRRLAGLSGRTSAEERTRVMTAFRAGEIDVLVATTVIEVGVDVPGATLMIVENAERFGLAQLHQLRGRVGRGKKAAACVLIADARTEQAMARLDVLVSTTDGFKIAERDLEIRGVGELFGTKQAGAPGFRVADLMKDRDLLALARRDAAEWIQRSPALDRAEERLLLSRLLKAHGEFLGLADMG